MEQSQSANNQVTTDVRKFLITFAAMIALAGVVFFLPKTPINPILMGVAIGLLPLCLVVSNRRLHPMTLGMFMFLSLEMAVKGAILAVYVSGDWYKAGMMLASTLATLSLVLRHWRKTHPEPGATTYVLTSILILSLILVPIMLVILAVYL